VGINDWSVKEVHARKEYMHGCMRHWKMRKIQRNITSTFDLKIKQLGAVAIKLRRNGHTYMCVSLTLVEKRKYLENECGKSLVVSAVLFRRFFFWKKKKITVHIYCPFL
jgi:hypothetical protein